MMTLDGLPTTKQGYFRLLETNKRVILPTNTHLRLLVSAADVLHSGTVPFFGLKIDACPGRLNQANLFIKRLLRIFQVKYLAQIMNLKLFKFLNI